MKRFLAAISCLFLMMTDAFSGEVFVPGLGRGSSIPVESYQESKFRGVVVQKYDFSCGSAALSTLLSYHYEEKTLEADAFHAMFDVGDKNKIRHEGFSLLDMKNYLVSRGYQGDGYRLDLDKLAAVGVPFIVLLNTKGYMHFVVVKGIDKDRVLVGDSALGRKSYQRDAFLEKWNGIAFLIRNKANISKKLFNQDDEWKVTHSYPLNYHSDATSLANLLIHLPDSRDF